MGSKRPPTGEELQKKLNDPSYLVEVALGPPNSDLVPQRPGTGLKMGGQYSETARSFVFKKAHLSFDDNRIFDERGEIVLVTHHMGKNPYESLDPLGLANTDQIVAPMGEWESICNATGYMGMPSFKVRPAHLSIHGRQYVQDPEGYVTYFNVAKKSRLKSMSLRHKLLVCNGESKDVVYTVVLDLAGRSIQLKNERDELEAIFSKSTKTLLLNAAFGAGSEMQIDIAPGVDWTAILATLIGIKQVGKSLHKDAFGNLIVDPALGAATGGAVALASDPAALEEAGNSLAGLTEGLNLEEAAASLGEGAGDLAEGGGEVLGAVLEFLGSMFQ